MSIKFEKKLIYLGSGISLTLASTYLYGWQFPVGFSLIILGVTNCYFFGCIS